MQSIAVFLIHHFRTMLPLNSRVAATCCHHALASKSIRIVWIATVLPVFAIVCSFALSLPAAERLIFEDRFEASSRGILQRNRVADSPPEGMGYPTDTPHGYALNHWIVADAESEGQRRAFWCIPVNASGQAEPNCMVPGSRSYARPLQNGRPHVKRS